MGKTLTYTKIILPNTLAVRELLKQLGYKLKPISNRVVHDEDYWNCIYLPSSFYAFKRTRTLVYALNSPTVSEKFALKIIPLMVINTSGKTFIKQVNVLQGLSQ